MSHAYDDFRRTSCTTKILNEKDGWYAFADTVFYGEKGGMLSDRGTINGQEVTGLKWEDDTLYHQVADPLSDPIRMQVAESYRFSNAAIQTALHVLDGYYAKLGLTIISVGVHPDNQWYEVDAKDLPEGHLAEVQRFMDQVIMHGEKVSFSYIDGKDYPDPAYAKYGEVRLVKIGDLNTQPCGTLHVSDTSEILFFAVLGSEKTARGTKIFVSCSFAADQRMREDYLTLKETGQILSAGRDGLAAAATKLVQSGKDLKKELEAARKELAGYKARELAGRSDKVIMLEGTDAGGLRAIGQELLAIAQSDKILVSGTETASCFMIISPTGKAREYLNAVKSSVNVSGGGSPKIVSGQGQLKTADLISAMQQLDI